MKVLRSLLLVMLLAPALAVVGASSALACSCVPPQPDRKAVKDAKAVFTGTMVEADVAEPGFTPGVWTFKVDTVYKGNVAQKQDVTSHTQSAACGLIFKEEKRYAVFAYEEKGKLQTNICTNTRKLSEAQTLELEPIAEYELTEAYGPEDGSPGDDALPLGIAIAVVGAGAIALSLTMAWLVRRAKERRQTD